MIVRYSVNASGSVVSSEIDEFVIGDFDAKLNFKQNDDHGSIISSASLERKLTRQEANRVRAHNRAENTPNGNLKIYTGITDELSNEFRKKLQTLEALGELHGLRNLDWEFPTIELIPEIEDTSMSPHILTYNFGDRQVITPHEWTFDLESFDWNLIEKLRVPISFYNRGNQLLDEGDYVTAYTNFIWCWKVYMQIVTKTLKVNS